MRAVAWLTPAARVARRTKVARTNCDCKTIADGIVCCNLCLFHGVYHEVSPMTCNSFLVVYNCEWNMEMELTALFISFISVVVKLLLMFQLEVHYHGYLERSLA